SDGGSRRSPPLRPPAPGRGRRRPRRGRAGGGAEVRHPDGLLLLRAWRPVPRGRAGWACAHMTDGNLKTMTPKRAKAVIDAAFMNLSHAAESRTDPDRYVQRAYRAAYDG